MIDVRARDTSGARKGLRFLVRGLTAALAVLFIVGCSHTVFIPGTPVVTLTAQRGNFTSYIITIDEIELTQSNGTVIELPTVAEPVDLAHLSNFTQLLEVPAVEEGTYVSATFVLDYGAPNITVDVDGQPGQVTLIDDATGVAPTTDTVTVTFDPNNPLVISNQNSSPVNFNIDLEASNTIDYAGGLPATVYIHPVITVSAVPTYEKPVFARGLFVFADTTKGEFTINARPLHDVVNNPFGALTIIPNDQTYYNVNGITYVGAAGLAAIAALKNDTATLQIGVVGTAGNPFGNLSTITPSFTATQVYAGTSLESTIQDHITGIVAGRSAGSNGTTTLQILGASLVNRIGEYGYTSLIPVTVAPLVTSGGTPVSGTTVSIDGVAAANLTLDAVSIGQQVDISGQVNPNDISNNFVNPDNTLNPDGLDATGLYGNGPGQIRIQPTTLWGPLTSGTTTSATIDLTHGWVEHYEPTYINFAGTGTSSSVDATAASYTIATPTDESATAAGTLLRFECITTPYGSGPPYFTANTVTPATSLPQQLIIEWTLDGSPNPFTDLAAQGIFINTADPYFTGTGAGAPVAGPPPGPPPVHVIRSGPLETDITTLPNPNPSLFVVQPASAAANSQYLYCVGNVTNQVNCFDDPATFARSIQYFTGAVNAVTKLVATGQYDGAGHFVATNIQISIY